MTGTGRQSGTGDGSPTKNAKNLARAFNFAHPRMRERIVSVWGAGSQIRGYYPNPHTISIPKGLQNVTACENKPYPNSHTISIEIDILPNLMSF